VHHRDVGGRSHAAWVAVGAGAVRQGPVLVAIRGQYLGVVGEEPVPPLLPRQPGGVHIGPGGVHAAWVCGTCPLVHRGTGRCRPHTCRGMTIAFNHAPAWWVVGLLAAVVATCFYGLTCACMAIRAGYGVAREDDVLDQSVVRATWDHRWVMVSTTVAALAGVGLTMAGLAEGRPPLVRAGLVAHAGLFVFQLGVLPRRINHCAARFETGETKEETSG